MSQKNRQKDAIPILIALRELAKYDALFIIQEIRKELLKIQEEKHIKNIFSKLLSDISDY